MFTTSVEGSCDVSCEINLKSVLRSW